MLILNWFRRRHIDTAPGGEDPSATAGKSPPLTWGAGVSLALTVAFYLIVLGVDAELHGVHEADSKPLDPVQPFLAGAPGDTAPLAYSPETTDEPASSPATLLARAHDCASSAQWDCVFDATISVIALRGETPEAVALLAQAMNEGETAPARNEHEAARPAQKKSAVARYARHGAGASAESVRATRYTRRVRKQTPHPAFVRYTAMARPASDKDLAELYRH